MGEACSCFLPRLSRIQYSTPTSSSTLPSSSSSSSSSSGVLPGPLHLSHLLRASDLDLGLWGFDLSDFRFICDLGFTGLGRITAAAYVMKFAKSMEELMVPEWNSQYIQYKAGKKKIKVVTSAFRTLTGVSPTAAKSSLNRTRNRAAAAFARSSLNPNWNHGAPKKDDPDNPLTWSPNPAVLRERNGSTSQAPGAGMHRPISYDTPQLPVEYPQEVYWRSGGTGQWDMRLGENGSPASFLSGERRMPPLLRLPEPIQPLPEFGGSSLSSSPQPAHPMLRARSQQEVGDLSPLPPLPDCMVTPKPSRRPSLADLRSSSRRSILALSPRPFVNRVSQFFVPRTSGDGMAVDISDAQIRAAAEFHQWLLQELYRIEEFYQGREAEAVQRFYEMKEQLDILRDRWFKHHYRIAYVGDAGGIHDENLQQEDADPSATSSGHDHPDTAAAHRRSTWRDTLAAIGRGKQDDNNPDADIMSLSSAHRDADLRRDYERRHPTNDPGHKLAKSKLKYAYSEYYHRLELLKSFVQLNRDAFRKITKKFDKVSGLRTSGKFMNEHINKSYFGGSDNRLDDLINDTEILFARFFVRSNRKEAALKLRTRENKSVYHSSLLRSGFYLGSSLVIGTSAVWEALQILKDPLTEPGFKVRTSYILQIWGGVFLILLQTLLFAINLRVWARNRINYAFIFEFDNRHQLNHRQFLEIPSLFGLLFTICFWFSIQNFWEGELDMIHFPIIFVGLAGAILFNPIKAFYFRARLYFMTTIVRLILSGFYRVEFKDFWMGDMLCSQTYALGNIYLYFCLYSQAWNKPEMCNSSHSYTMGFFTCVPAIWRLLQCFRRYYDSRQAFPHLANGAKYALTILQYAMLSLWRNDKPNELLKGAFITSAAISSLVSIFWDVVMDWSLLNPYAKWPFIRDTIGFKKPWVYYFAMFIDPPLRFSWVFYIIYANEIQHSALLSFLISVAEVFRRFIWCFFRMENEHCGNVGANRAYRDPCLPYHFASDYDPTAMVASPVPFDPDVHTDPLLVTPSQPTVDIEQGHATGMRRRARRHGPSSPAMQALERLGRTMTNAHKKDYERKRATDLDDGTASSSDDEEEEEEEAAAAAAEDFFARTADGVRERSGTVGTATTQAGMERMGRPGAADGER